MKTIWRYSPVLFLLFLVAICGISCSNPSNTSEVCFYSMGTFVRIVVGTGAGCQMGEKEIKRLEKLFDRFDAKSEISRLNRGEKFKLSKDTVAILNLSERMRRLTDGAFNIRYHGTIDLGGIAKGYAADKAREVLMKNGAKSGMIDMASSIAVFGPSTFKIGIRDPRHKDKVIGKVELLPNTSLSTSGLYERGKHIIDPRTNKPADTALSITVIGRSAGETDALSTAVFVLGPEKGTKLLDRLGYKYFIIDKQGNIIKNQ